MIFSRILVPTDGTEASLRGARSRRADGGPLSAPNSWSSRPCRCRDWLARQNMEPGAIEALRGEAARKSLEDRPWLSFGGKGVGAEVKVVVGPAPESILAEIEESGADLVVMGRRGRDEPKDLLLGQR